MNQVTSVLSREIQTTIEAAANLIRAAGNGVVLTGAGISTPSGIPDFRSPGSGLWSRFNPMEVASLSAFRYHPEKFLDWFHPLAEKIFLALPNPAHRELALLEKAYTLDPVSPALIVTMGQALSMLGRFDEALAYYQEAMDIEPAYASSYYLMGELHAFVHGRLDLGVRWGMEAAAIDPRYVTNLQALGIYYLALGDDGQAEYWINRALEAGPDRFRANRAAGFLYYQRGDDAKVREVARRLEAIAPGNNATLYLLVALADYREVLRYAAADHPELACDREPDIGRVNLMPAINISLALEESGDADCANRLLDGALDRMQSIPRLGVLGYGFADAEIHARQGRPELALAALRQAVEEGCCVFWWSQAERSPHTTSLRDDPRFIVIMNTIRDEMAGQLASVREMGLARDSAGEVEMEAAIIEGAE